MWKCALLNFVFNLKRITHAYHLRASLVVFPCFTGIVVPEEVKTEAFRALGQNLKTVDYATPEKTASPTTMGSADLPSEEDVSGVHLALSSEDSGDSPKA